MRNLYLASRSSLAFWLITGEGILASVSVFETKGRAEESNRIAASWVKEGLPGLWVPVEITAGKAHPPAGEARSTTA
jgi:hypothetical protein